MHVVIAKLPDDTSQKSVSPVLSIFLHTATKEVIPSSEVHPSQHVPNLACVSLPVHDTLHARVIVLNARLFKCSKRLRAHQHVHNWQTAKAQTVKTRAENVTDSRLPDRTPSRHLPHAQLHSVICHRRAFQRDSESNKQVAINATVEQHIVRCYRSDHLSRSPLLRLAMAQVFADSDNLQLLSALASSA